VSRRGLRAGSYEVLLADPPWRYLSWGQSLLGRQNHYPRLPTDDLCQLPVARLAAPDAALFLWATGPRLPDALRVMEAWGFAYTSMAFTWIKVNADASPAMGLGYYTRGNAELCLLGTRGDGLPVVANDIPSVVVSRRREHSRKPDGVYDYIERMFGPERTRLELFARRQWPGWHVVGNDVDGQPIHEVLGTLIRGGSEHAPSVLHYNGHGSSGRAEQLTLELPPGRHAP
jgi:N6-adenosine-specific RNA methylase IME4